MWQSKAELKALVQTLRERICDLEKDKKFLQEEISKLREALIAKESPTAFFEQRKSTYSSPDPEEDKKNKILHYTKLLASEIEQPLFNNADEMISNLQKVIGFPGISSIDSSDES